ncbi:hypothetical protein BJF78_20780 [Pseudonocardia sp. CNS-139]|nr:hypothetical protein BJF78_20780 [Pseudonocardia sp. CNS-139]
MDVRADAVERGEDRHDVALQVLGELRELVDQPHRGVHLLLGELGDELPRDGHGLLRDRPVGREQAGGVVGGAGRPVHDGAGVVGDGGGAHDEPGRVGRHGVRAGDQRGGAVGGGTHVGEQRVDPGDERGRLAQHPVGARDRVADAGQQPVHGADRGVRPVDDPGHAPGQRLDVVEQAGGAGRQGDGEADGVAGPAGHRPRARDDVGRTDPDGEPGDAQHGRILAHGRSSGRTE